MELEKGFYEGALGEMDSYPIALLLPRIFYAKKESDLAHEIDLGQLVEFVFEGLLNGVVLRKINKVFHIEAKVERQVARNDATMEEAGCIRTRFEAD